MTEPAFLDTNVLVYAFDDDQPAKQERARALLVSAGTEGWGRISVQVLQEFYAVVTRKLGRPLPHALAAEAVAGLTALPVVPTDGKSVRAAIARCAEASVSLWDSMIIQAAVEGGCARLLSEDLQDGQILDGVRVSNPFAS
jgi:predicted nucleic acid-binding protein